MTDASGVRLPSYGHLLDNMRQNARCPECRCNWWLHPPAKLTCSEEVRCVQCKSVYPLAILASSPTPGGDDGRSD